MMVSARLTPEAKAALIRQHPADGVPLTRLAAVAGLPARTLRRWAASYRTDPTASALQRQERSDLGRRRLPETWSRRSRRWRCAGRPRRPVEAAQGAALLVVGARGAGAFTRLMNGSTCTEVVHHAHVPVAVVPCPTHGTAHAS